MNDFLQQFSPITQALMATLFTWGVTAAGAALVFFTKTVKAKVMDSMLGFAAGVMIAASFWSLLAPRHRNGRTDGTPLDDCRHRIHGRWAIFETG